MTHPQRLALTFQCPECTSTATQPMPHGYRHCPNCHYENHESYFPPIATHAIYEDITIPLPQHTPTQQEDQ